MAASLDRKSHVKTPLRRIFYRYTPKRGWMEIPQEKELAYERFHERYPGVMFVSDVAVSRVEYFSEPSAGR
jgi:hypothetical protein